MSESGSHEAALDNMSREEIMSALFGHMIIQNANMALMFLGQTPHPQSGEKVVELETAKMFIDQLEMLEVKTKGNLTREEHSGGDTQSLDITFPLCTMPPPTPRSRAHRESSSARRGRNNSGVTIHRGYSCDEA